MLEYDGVYVVTKFVRHGARARVVWSSPGEASLWCAQMLVTAVGRSSTFNRDAETAAHLLSEQELTVVPLFGYCRAEESRREGTVQVPTRPGFHSS